MFIWRLWCNPFFASQYRIHAIAHIKTMNWPYLSFYWSNWPHLFIDICLYELFVLINAQGMEGERLVSVIFVCFVLTFCAPNSQTMIRPYLSFYWSNWPHLFIDICLYELFVLINVLGMEGGAACVWCLVSDGCSNFRENIFYTHSIFMENIFYICQPHMLDNHHSI